MAVTYLGDASGELSMDQLRYHGLLSINPTRQENTMTESTTTYIGALCENCRGGDGFESCRRDGGCGCGCHLCLAQMESCEFDTDPFTTDERIDIARYNSRIGGIPDCFDCHTIDTIPGEFTLPIVLDMLRSYFGLLNEWREAITTLAEDLADGQPMSEAGRRYLGMELASWKQAQEAHRVLVIEWALGRDQYGDAFTSAAIVHSCSVDGNPMAGVFSFHEQQWG